VVNEDKSETLEWRVFLLGSQPGRGAMAIGICLITLWFTQSLGKSAWITGVASFILLASLSNFLLPTRYRMDSTHVLVRNPLYWRRRAWTEFRAFTRAGNRVNLRTLPRESRLDHYRGMLIIMDPVQREEIIKFIASRIEESPDGTA
jgi:hypothetical protein